MHNEIALMTPMPTLKDVLKKYANHPQFIGVTLVDPNERGARDDTALHLAASIGDTSDIEVLVEHGADINAIGDLGNTPLHYASLMGQSHAVEHLLLLGAKSEIRNNFMQTALDIAKLGHKEAVIQILLSLNTH